MLMWGAFTCLVCTYRVATAPSGPVQLYKIQVAEKSCLIYNLAGVQFDHKITQWEVSTKTLY